MIQIAKQRTAPKKLREVGFKETKAFQRKYDGAPSEYQAGRKRFEFDRKIYAHRTVKTMLRRAQHEKCCFCESKISHVANGDVEHFRPKAGYRQQKNDSLERPGYYWLAYEWDNLLLCCEICNRRYKGNLFPLGDSAQRALSHHDPLGDERPLFLNPSVDAVESFIGFREEYPFAIRDDRRTKVTIEQLGLEREELAEFRREILAPLKRIISCYRLLRENFPAEARPIEVAAEIAELREQLVKSVEPSAHYSSMARAAIGSLLEE